MAEFKSNCIFLLFHLVPVFLILKYFRDILKDFFRLLFNCVWHLRKRMNQNKSVLQEVLRLQSGGKAIKAAYVGSPEKCQRNKGTEQEKAASGDSLIAAKQLCTGCQSPACSQDGQTTLPTRSSRLRSLLLLRLTCWEGVCKSVPHR